MLKAELKVSGGMHVGKVIPLSRQRFLIGRGDDCQLRPASEQISRHHCVFSIDDFTVRLRDLGSTNGTFVNDAQLAGEVILKPGDNVRMGPLAFEILISDEQAEYDAATVAEAGQPLLPQTPAPETMELAATDTSLDVPASSSETHVADAEERSDATVVFPDAEVQPPAPPQPVPAGPPGVQPHPAQQPMPGGMPYQQPGYPYPLQPAMPYPQPGYGYPGYMPMPGQYPPPAGYPPPAAYPADDTVGPGASAEDTATELPVQLPDPASTGALPPPEKPAASAGDGSAAPAANPSVMAADIIKNMRNRRPSAGE